jgi:hypothetical protein
MPITPTVLPVDAVPTPPAALAYQFNRRAVLIATGVALAGGNGAASTETATRVGKPASVGTIMRILASIEQVARLCATTLETT